MAVTKDEILNVVKKHLVDAVDDLDPTDVDPAVSMRDLGANSLDMVEVVSHSMRELKIKIPRSELSKLTNIQELVDLFYVTANGNGADS